MGYMYIDEKTIRSLQEDREMLLQIVKAYRTNTITYQNFLDSNVKVKTFMAKIEKDEETQDRYRAILEKKAEAKRLKEQKIAECKAQILVRFTEEECRIIGYRKSGYRINKSKGAA